MSHPRGKYPRGPERRALSSQIMTRITARRWADDYDRTRAVSVANGKTSTAYLWECHECGRVIAGPAIGNHQKVLEHRGRTLIGTRDHDRGETRP